MVLPAIEGIRALRTALLLRHDVGDVGHVLAGLTVVEIQPASKYVRMFIAKHGHLLLFRTGVDPGFLLSQSQARDSGKEDRQDKEGGHGWAGVAGQSVRSCPLGGLLYTSPSSYLSCVR